MKNILRNFKSSLIFLQIFVLSIYVNAQNEEFTFVFATDIHIQKERNADKGFTKAIEEINKLNPDFVITGGDLVMDALGANFNRADSQYNLYNETIKLLNAPLFNTIGNHEIFGWYKKSNVDRSHPEFGKKMYQNRIGKLYYSFIHKGVKFIILDSIEEVAEENGYYGFINSEQIEWLKKELSETEKTMPIIISTHIPLYTMFAQMANGSMAACDRGLVIENSKEVLELLKEHNLKLILQGHLHVFEDLNIMNRFRIITGGAVSARWWQGPNQGMEEGFLIVKVKKDKIESEYFDYGWQVE
ncbi:MAG: metallophosphoesterase [Ignavibacteriae bacterium]|nr:metallophosphoesterase [Ignavibacteriota bacterium]